MLASFFKKNGSMISKLFVNQLGLAIFGFSVTVAVTMYIGGMEESQGNLYLGLVSAFAVLFYMFLLFVATNDAGASDKIRVDADRMKRDNLLGLKWALCANSLNYILAVAITVAHFAGFESVEGFLAPVTVIIQAPFMGLRSVFMPNNLLAYYIMPLIPTITCTVGYILGLKGFLFITEKKKRKY